MKLKEILDLIPDGIKLTIDDETSCERFFLEIIRDDDYNLIISEPLIPQICFDYNITEINPINYDTLIIKIEGWLL